MAGQQTQTQRIDLLEKIGYGEDADVDDREHFDLLIKNLRTLNGERNTVIHGQWGMKGEKVSLEDLVLLMTGPMPSELIEAKNKRRTFSPGDLIQLADDLHGASMLVWDLHRQFVKYPSDG